MTLSGTSIPPALPTEATEQRRLSCPITRASIEPPTASTPRPGLGLQRLGAARQVRAGDDRGAPRSRR